MASTLLNNIVSYWKLDGDSTDAVGTNNGTDTAITYGSAYGKINQGADFNGTTSKITQPLVLGNAGSISFWMNPFNLAGTKQEYYIAGGESGTTTSFTLQNWNNGNSYWGWTNSTDYRIILNTAFPTGYFHVVFTWDSATGESILYWNAVSVGSTTGVVPYTMVTPPAFGILDNVGVYTYPYAGDEDEIGIWSRALTQAEVTELYNSGAGLQYPFAPPVTVHPSFLLNFLT